MAVELGRPPPTGVERGDRGHGHCRFVERQALELVADGRRGQILEQQDKVARRRVELGVIGAGRADRAGWGDVPVEAHFLFIEVERLVDHPGARVRRRELGDKRPRRVCRRAIVVERQSAEGAHEPDAHAQRLG